MKKEEKIKRWLEIGEKIFDLQAERKYIMNTLCDEIMPYKRGQIIMCLSRYHNGKYCRVNHFKLSGTETTWIVKVIVNPIADQGFEMDPTTWSNQEDELLQAVVEDLNDKFPPINNYSFKTSIS